MLGMVSLALHRPGESIIVLPSLPNLVLDISRAALFRVFMLHQKLPSFRTLDNDLDDAPSMLESLRQCTILLDISHIKMRTKIPSLDAAL